MSVLEQATRHILVCVTSHSHRRSMDRSNVAFIAVLLMAANAALICRCLPGATTPANNSSASAANSADAFADSTSKMATGDVNFTDIMQKCNESHPVSMGNTEMLPNSIRAFIIALTADYLSELNSTGSFPDETDKGPMASISAVGWTTCGGDV